MKKGHYYQEKIMGSLFQEGESTSTIGVGKLHVKKK
jgi:hypothetical protein